MGQMHAVAHIERQIHNDEAGIPLYRANLLYVGLCTGNGSGECGDDASQVLQFYPQLDRKLAFHIRVPTNGHTFFRIVPDFGDIVAIIGVNNHATTRTDMTNDRITRNWMTALGVIHYHAFRAPNG